MAFVKVVSRLNQAVVVNITDGVQSQQAWPLGVGENLAPDHLVDGLKKAINQFGWDGYFDFTESAKPIASPTTQGSGKGQGENNDPKDHSADSPDSPADTPNQNPSPASIGKGGRPGKQ